MGDSDIELEQKVKELEEREKELQEQENKLRIAKKEVEDQLRRAKRGSGDDGKRFGGRDCAFEKETR